MVVWAPRLRAMERNLLLVAFEDGAVYARGKVNAGVKEHNQEVERMALEAAKLHTKVAELQRSVEDRDARLREAEVGATQ